MRTVPLMPEEANMEVFVSAPSFRVSNSVFPGGSLVRDVLSRFVQQQGVSSEDFYVVTNGRLSELEDPLQPGAVYHLEPRLCGGKGGFGSMLRALGAQIEKTTNREACRDLSGRRLRDVNHEKEMAEWLKNQAEREAEKEQRRLERLQRKLAEPKHQFTDPEYQRQCHDLSERLEDSVIRGLQASSGAQVKADDGSAAKRPNPDQSEQPHAKKKKTSAAACFWTGLGELDELLSSEEDDGEEEESPSTSSSGCGAAAVTTTTQRAETEVEPEQNNSPSPAADCSPSAERPVRPPEESGSPPQQQGRAVDLSSLLSVAQLEALGLDVLKEELTCRGLKCGGTLTERAARLFSIRGLTPDQIDPALLAKPGKTKTK